MVPPPPLSGNSKRNAGKAIGIEGAAAHRHPAAAQGGAVAHLQYARLDGGAAAVGIRLRELQRRAGGVHIEHRAATGNQGP